MKVLGDDLDGVIYFEDKKLYLMDDHSWAFFAWEMERLKGNIQGNSSLLHFDNHLDDVHDRIDINGLMEAKTKEELLSLIASKQEREFSDYDNKISIDNFIWPSFARGTLGSMYIVSPQNQDSLASWLLGETEGYFQREGDQIEKEHFFDQIPKEKVEKVRRVSTFEQFDIEEYTNLVQESNKILNIDLDYFNRSENLLEPDLMPDNKVKTILNQLITSCDWDLITVAISPLYCGGEPEARHLLHLFLKVTDLSIERGIKIND